METQTSTIQAPTTTLSGDWRVDPGRSRVRFHTRAMFGLLPVLGRFERFGGALHVADTGQATGDLRIESASIRTGISKRDGHLRTEDFFHADAYPYLTFKLTGLRTGSDIGEVTGTLGIRGKTLPIRARAAIADADSELQIDARFPVDHDAAGLGWAKPGLIRKVIDADVQLTLTRETANDV
jgi:polyisoprenoid-binding protein YceI